MLKTLPRWVEFGAFFLAMLAGIVNAVGLNGFEHQSVSHLSGIATQLGKEIIEFHDYSWHIVMILASFLAGSVISGFIIGNAALKLGRHYSSALFLEGLFLVISMAALLKGETYGHYFASAACGLQNALVTTYSGAIIRTTHVTGIFTDLGIMIGSMLRGKDFDRRKAFLFTMIIGGFVSGGSVGYILFYRIGFYTLALPACMAFLLSVIYFAYAHHELD